MSIVSSPRHPRLGVFVLLRRAELDAVHVLERPSAGQLELAVLVLRGVKLALEHGIHGLGAAKGRSTGTGKGCFSPEGIRER